MRLPTGSLARSGAGPTDAALVVAARGRRIVGAGGAVPAARPDGAGTRAPAAAADDEVDDLVQDCFVSALKRLSALDNPQAFAAWLGSIVVRAVGKRLRRRRLLSRLGLRVPEEIDADAIAAPSVPATSLSSCGASTRWSAQLPAQARVALVLRRVDGLEVPEIARRMGLVAVDGETASETGGGAA